MAERNPRSAIFAKTTRPVVASVVVRERLYARLDGTPARTLAWIAGPPGAGKTCLAASYVDARRYRALWYHVDPDDDDVATFFHYLAHAAAKLGGTREFPVYSERFGADLAAYARKFFRQLFAATKGPVALVLDSLHAVPAESPLHTVLEAACGQVPRGSCLVVTSRDEPPAALARLRLTGEMVALSGEHLRFDAAEVAEIARLRGAEVSTEALAQLAEHTRGWAAGVILVLEHAKLSGRLVDYPRGATPKSLFDYLAGEIFHRFEPRTRQFLLRIACLPRMTAAIAEALSGEALAGRLLVNLALNDYFVSDGPSEEGRIFQLHPLLRDFLLDRAAVDLPEALATEHLQHAAAVLARHGHAEDAVALLIQARDWAGVARIASEQAPAMLAQGRIATLGSWLELVPDELLGGDPVLLHALGACRVAASPRAARRLFERAHEAAGAKGDAVTALAAARGVVDAIILEFDDLSGLDRWGAELSRLLEGTRSAGLEGADAAARTDLEVTRALARLLRGEFAAARGLIEEVSALPTLPPRSAIMAGVGVALLHLFSGAHEQALAVCRENLERSAAEGLHPSDGWLHGIAAAAHLSVGDRDGAREELQGAGTAQRRGDRAIALYLRAWLATLDGDAALAAAEARSAAELAAETAMPWLECLARVALGQLLGERGELRGCDVQLHRAAVIARALGIPNLRLNVLLAEAEVELRGKDPAEGLRRLAAALAFGREHGLRHVAGWRPQAMAELCAVALRHGIEPEYVKDMVRARGFVPKVLPVRVRDWPWPLRLGVFGGLRLLRDDQPVEFSGKGPGRPMELLKVLVANGAQNVRADLLADALWPHVDADYAHNSFTATLHRLRRLLGDESALLLGDGRLSLNPARFWVDAWALEQAMAELAELLRSPVAPEGLPAMRALVDEVFTLYRGPFLPDESEQPAYIACREQVRATLLRCLTRVARVWEEAGQADAAADCYLRCLQADPLFEGPYRNLMLCYQRMGEAIEARATYDRLKTLLSARLKTAPSPETRAVFEALPES